MRLERLGTVVGKLTRCHDAQYLPPALRRQGVVLTWSIREKTNLGKQVNILALRDGLLLLRSPKNSWNGRHNEGRNSGEQCASLHKRCNRALH